MNGKKVVEATEVSIGLFLLLANTRRYSSIDSGGRVAEKKVIVGLTDCD
jgi:hypothetical protein